ncbi:MAG: OmpA family protein [Gammaproteobacteria bacterium]|nr:OmpA family protein [Gammaproteobacteria bacterium]
MQKFTPKMGLTLHLVGMGAKRISTERGTKDFNKSLGNQRARAIKENLISKGINENQINLISYGEEKPAVFGNNDDAWRSNRRAMFVYSDIPGQQAKKQDSQTNSANKMFVSDQ